VNSFGLIIPQRAALFGVAPLPDLLALAPIAEQSDLIDTVWIGDSLTSKARAESLACLGALAGMTSRLRLAVGCLGSFPVRDPALFAYQWATLDQISDGRMLLAVCNGLQKRGGASEREGAHFGGVPDRQRAARLEEYLDLVRQLWTGEAVRFEGRFAQYEDIAIQPTPVQQPCPIWIGANPPATSAARLLTRIATRSDGLLTVRTAPGYIAALRDRLAPELANAGKDPAQFPIAAYHSINIGPDREECLDEAQRFFDLYYGEGMFDRTGAAAITAAGPVEECVEQLRAVQAEGVTHLALRIASWRQREQLELVIDKVLPALAS